MITIDSEKIIFPAQCKCGHIFLEKFVWPTPNANGEIGFAWCGFCRNRESVKKKP